MNTAHKQAISTLLPPGQVATRAGTAQQPRPGTKPAFGVTRCAENVLSTLGKLWSWRIPAMSHDSRLTGSRSRLAVRSRRARRCLREAWLQSSSCLKPQRGAPLKVRLTHSHGLVRHTKTYTCSSGTKTGLRSFPRRPSPFPDSKTSRSLPRLLS